MGAGWICNAAAGWGVQCIGQPVRGLPALVTRLACLPWFYASHPLKSAATLPQDNIESEEMSDECRAEVKKDEVGLGRAGRVVGAGHLQPNAGERVLAGCILLSGMVRPRPGCSITSWCVFCSALLTPQLKAGTDFRLNVRLTKACTADVQKLCKGG